MNVPTDRDLLMEAVARHREGDRAAAVPLYRELLRRQPDAKLVLWNLLVALRELGDLAGAIAQAQRLIEVAPDHEDARYNLGYLLRETGRFEEAIAEFEAILQRNAEHEKAQLRLNETLRMLARPSGKDAKRVCVYSAIFGDYDPIREPVRQSLDCDYILFTDRPDMRPPESLWKVVTFDTSQLFRIHPRLRAKYFRIMAHEFFPMMSRMNHDVGLHRYDHVIWVDGSVRITSPDFASFMIGSIREHGIAMLKHPTRRCIYTEAAFSAQLPKYRYQRISEQVEHYRQQGYPENNGLMAATVSARDLRRRDLDEVFEDWWEENLAWTYQDQISLPYVLWKHGRWYDEIDQDLTRNPYFDWEYVKRKRSSLLT